MSKPISFGFGKSKSITTTSTASKPSTTSITFPSQKPSSGLSASRPRPSRSALRGDDSDVSDEEPPRHESVAGFSSSGVILSQPRQEKQERVIENHGNQDWRRRGRGKNILPDDVRAAQSNGGMVMVEKNEVSKASGLQFAEPTFIGATEEDRAEAIVDEPEEDKTKKPVDADAEALKALLEDGTGKPSGTAVIIQQANVQLRPQDEIEDFRTDVASRPDSATLEDYAVMPVEEFGLAMLRGMGKKRRANGEVINLDLDKKDDTKRQKKNEGFLGIGAKPVPGMEGVELGAWGKADMRKNSKGAGFFTPVMMVDKRTGEKITEEELDRRKKEARDKDRTGKVEEDWRSRRDKNLERNGRDGHRSGDDQYRDQRNDLSKPDQVDGDYKSSKSRRRRDEMDEDDSSRSRTERSRSRDRRRRDHDDYDRDRKRDRHRDKYHDEHRHTSSSSRRDRDGDGSRHRERGDERDYKKSHDREDRRYKDRR